MRKILILVSLMIFVIGFGVSAEKFDFVGGLTYNSFDMNMDAEIIGLDLNFEFDEKKDMGFYAGLRYALQDNIALGVGLDKAGSFEENDVEQSILGPYAEVVYKLNECIDLRAAVAFYQYDMDFDMYFRDKTYEAGFEGDDVGFIFGGGYQYPIQENLSFNASLDYRILNINVENVDIEIIDNVDVPIDVSFINTALNLNGFRLGAGIMYSF